MVHANPSSSLTHHHANNPSSLPMYLMSPMLGDHTGGFGDLLQPIFDDVGDLGGADPSTVFLPPDTMSHSPSRSTRSRSHPGEDQSAIATEPHGMQVSERIRLVVTHSCHALSPTSNHALPCHPPLITLCHRLSATSTACQ